MNYQKLHQDAAQIVARLTEKAVSECGKEAKDAHRAYVAVGAISGALEPLAFIVSADRSIDNDVILFASLLAARSIRILGSFKVGAKAFGVEQESEFGASIIYEALQSFEKLTGRNIDAKLDAGMVAAARDPECRAEMNRQRAKIQQQERARMN